MTDTPVRLTLPQPIDLLEERHSETVLAALARLKPGTVMMSGDNPRLPAMPEVTAAELFIEKRATFAAVPGLTRPLNSTPWPTLALAGDWTDTGYPGVLEGAVRSGLQAARVLAPLAG